MTERLRVIEKMLKIVLREHNLTPKNGIIENA